MSWTVSCVMVAMEAPGAALLPDCSPLNSRVSSVVLPSWEARMDDPHDLQRFVDAQDPVYHDVRLELAAGSKRSHWMWFIFPQMKDLGRSATARHYGIVSRAEAQAYWQHPVLGPRLKECAGLGLAGQGRTG